MITDIWWGRILWRGYVHPHNHPYPIEKIKDSPYSYSIPKLIPSQCENFHQDRDGLRQYPHKQVYLPILIKLEF